MVETRCCGQRPSTYGIMSEGLVLVGVVSEGLGHIGAGAEALDSLASWVKTLCMPAQVGVGLEG